MPGLYDLLPTYRCVDDGSSVRALTAANIESIGGRGDLATAAFDHRTELELLPISGHRPLIGVEQPTLSSLDIREGRAEGLFHTFSVDNDGELHRHRSGSLKRFPGLGDGTVPRNSAVPRTNHDVFPLPQQHGPIVRADEAITFVIDTILHRGTDFGQRLGQGEIGIQTPDVVCADAEFEVSVVGVDQPNDIRTRLFDVETGHQIDRPKARVQDGEIVIPTTLPAPGLYRIAVAGSANSAVNQLVLAVEDLPA